MTAPPHERKPAPKIDPTDAAVSLFEWLQRGGSAPDYLAALAPRQYEEVLGKIRERMDVFGRLQVVTLQPVALETLLEVATRMPSTRAGTQARAVAVKFAIGADSSGVVAIATLGKVIDDVTLGVKDADFFIRQSGSLADAILGLATAWVETSEGGRPSSAQTTALARLASAELAAGGGGIGSARAALLRAIAAAFRAVRVRDSGGEADPLLAVVSSAYEVAADAMSAPPSTVPTQAATPESAIDRRARVFGEIRGLVDGLQAEFSRLDGVEDDARSVRVEVQALRSQRDELENVVAGLRATIDRRNDEIGDLKAALAAATATATDAEAAVSKWRGEADQARREAENATRERLAQAARDFDKMIDRYLTPVLRMLEQGSIGAEEMQPVRVNLENLGQKIGVLTKRMSEPTSLPSGSPIGSGAGSTDEAGN